MWMACAATVAALVAQGTAANADPGDHLIGGCNLVSVTSDPLTAGQTDAIIAEVSASLEGSVTGGPSFATVSCWISINGVEAHATRLNAGGFGVQVGELQTSYATTSTDVVALCQQVTFLDGSTWTAADGNVGTDCTTLP